MLLSYGHYNEGPQTCDLKQNLFIFICLRKLKVQKWFLCGLQEVFALLAAAVGQFISRLSQALEAAGVSWSQHG